MDKAGKQPQGPLTDEQIKKIHFICVYIYIVEYDSPIKGMKITPFVATWMDLEIIIQSEVRQTERDKYMIADISTNEIYKKKSDTDELTYKTEIDSQTQKANLCLPKGKGGDGERDKFGIWD